MRSFDRPFAIRELHKLKKWLGSQHKEEEFVTKVNQERSSCSYIANIANSLKHSTDFLEPKTMNPELLPIAKQTNKVCCHIANGFSRKTQYNAKFRNMLQEERDKLIDLKQ